MGAIFDPIDWIDPNHPGQTMLLSFGFWHEQPCILLNVKDYPVIIDLGRQLVQLRCPTLAFCQLVAITIGQQTITDITRPRQIYGVMEPNGAALRYNLIQI
jgi:hypothetical protein